MPKKLLFYSFGLLVLVITGMYGFTKWTESREKINLWTLVPEDAVFVVESSDHDSLLQQIQESELWNNIASVRAVESLTENIAQLDSLTGGRKDGASRFLKRKSMLTSVHVVNKNDFDYVFYIPVNTVGEHRFIRSLVENLGKSPDFTETTQEYQQILITHIKNELNQDTFSYFTYHNNLVVSANPELVKEIIRKVNRRQLASPAQEYERINYLGQPDVFAHVFVNYRHLPSFLNIFLEESLAPEITYLASLCRNSMLGLKHQRGKIFLNGFSNPEPLAESLNNHLENQPPKPLPLREYLPNRTALLLTFGLDAPSGFRHVLPADKKIAWPTRQIILADSLARTFQNTLAIGYILPEKEKGHADKIIFVQTRNPAQTTGILNAIIKESGPGTAVKSMADVPAITSVPVPHLPLLLFGSVAQGFPTCYVAQVDDFLFFGKDAAALRAVLTQIKNKNVWGQTDRMKNFLANTQQETNFSLYLDADLIWPLLRNHVRDNQQSSLLRHETLVKYFSQVALQFSRQDDQFYTSLVITHPVAGADTQTTRVETFREQYTANFKTELTSAPFLIDRRVGGAVRVLIQDSARTLHALRDNGQVAWSDSLQEQILAPVYPTVLGNDKRIKYLFTTRNIIHCLDQNGREIQNFPFNLPDTVRVQRLTLLPAAEHNGLFLVYDQHGQLFMFDRVGNLQPGWEPKKTGSPLAAPPQYFNINGREVILTLHQSGYVYAYNLRGQPYPGFPLAFDGTFSAEIFTNPGKTFRASQVTAVTTQGTLITFNLAGQVQQRRKLPVGNQRAIYQLVVEPQGKSYIIFRQEPGKISLYSPGFKLLLQKNFITSSPKLVQYFDFGPLNRLYALTETGPAKLYLYNYRARLIGGQPLANKLPIALEYSQNTQTYTLYTVRGPELHKSWFQDK